PLAHHRYRRLREFCRSPCSPAGEAVGRRVSCHLRLEIQAPWERSGQSHLHFANPRLNGTRRRCLPITEEAYAWWRTYPRTACRRQKTSIHVCPLRAKLSSVQNRRASPSTAAAVEDHLCYR